MTPFLTGFTDELTKTAVVKWVGRKLMRGPGYIMKRPRRAIYGLMGGAVVGSAAYQAARGYKKGRSGARGRYLHAGVGPGGRVRASEAAYYPFHKHFPRELSAREKRELSKHHAVAFGGKGKKRAKKRSRS